MFVLIYLFDRRNTCVCPPGGGGYDVTSCLVPCPFQRRGLPPWRVCVWGGGGSGMHSYWRIGVWYCRANGKTRFLSFFRSLLDFIKNIYNRVNEKGEREAGDALQASKHMMDFLSFPAKHYFFPIVPSFSNAVTAMELQVQSTYPDKLKSWSWPATPPHGPNIMHNSF